MDARQRFREEPEIAGADQPVRLGEYGWFAVFLLLLVALKSAESLF